MARTTRYGRLVRVRGAFGAWKTYTRADGPVREVRGWDAVTMAAVDGGGSSLQLAGYAYPAADPAADTAAEEQERADTDRRSRERRRRTAQVGRTARTTRHARRGGRR